jgi:hypothetical protein
MLKSFYDQLRLHVRGKLPSICQNPLRYCEYGRNDGLG